MPLPDGIQVCTITFGGATDFAGTGLTNKLVATPSIDAIWKTGPHRLGGPSFQFEQDADADVVGTIALPFVDQDGFKDDTGADVTGWYYQLILTLGRTVNGGAQEVIRKLFSPRVGQTTVAFDDIPFGTARPATTVAPMPVTSVNGQTGALTGFATDDDLADLVPASTVGQPSGVAALDIGGRVPRAQLPNVSGVVDHAGVASQAAMLALTSPDPDTQLRVLRTDTPGVQWVLNPGLDPTVLGNWLQEPFDVSGAAAAAQAAAQTYIDGKVTALSGVYGPGGTAGNIGKSTALGLAAAIQIALGN